MNPLLYETTLPGGAHWSLVVRRGTLLRLTDVAGGANAAMLFYNPLMPLERYNAPDTLKCQHTFRLTAGHCLYSDMGRVFCTIVEDSLGWHDTVTGNATAAKVAAKWGAKRYQEARNERHQNGYDGFLVELAKYGLGRRDMAANVNFFTKVAVGDDGALAYAPGHSPAGARVGLRFEMDTLVVLHTCPHPLNPAAAYPRAPVKLELSAAEPARAGDPCFAHAENRRGFENNRLYHGVTP